MRLGGPGLNALWYRAKRGGNIHLKFTCYFDVQPHCQSFDPSLQHMEQINFTWAERNGTKIVNPWNHWRCFNVFRCWVGIKVLAVQLHAQGSHSCAVDLDTEPVQLNLLQAWLAKRFHCDISDINQELYNWHNREPTESFHMLSCDISCLGVRLNPNASHTGKAAWCLLNSG